MVNDPSTRRVPAIEVSASETGAVILTSWSILTRFSAENSGVGRGFKGFEFRNASNFSLKAIKEAVLSLALLISSADDVDSSAIGSGIKVGLGVGVNEGSGA